MSFYRRSTSALTAGILVGGLVIATTSSSVAFLTGFLISVQGVPAATVENVAWIVVLTLIILFLAAYIAARRYISDSPHECLSAEAEETGSPAVPRRNMSHVIAAMGVVAIVVLVSGRKGDSTAKLGHR